MNVIFMIMTTLTKGSRMNSKIVKFLAQYYH